MNQLRNAQTFSFGNDLLEKVELKSLLQPLWLNKWLILLTTIVFLFLGYQYTRTLKPKYTTNAILQLEEQSNLFNIDKDFSAASLFSSKGSSGIGLHTALIKSRYILEPVIARLGLDLEIIPYGKSRASGGRSTENNNNIQVKQFYVPVLEEGKAFTIKVKSKNQYELYDSAQELILKGEVGKVANATLRNGESYVINVPAINANIDSQWEIIKHPMQQTVDKMIERIQIHDVSQDLQLSSTVGILKVSMIGLDPEQITQILNTIAQVVVEKSAEKKSQEATKTLQFINQQLPSIRKSLDQAESTLSNYLAEHGMIDLNSESKLIFGAVTLAQKNLSFLKMNRQVALQKYTTLHPVILAIDQKIKIVSAELETLKKDLSQLPARDQKILSLMRDVRVKSQLYMILLNKAQGLQIARGGTISDVSILGTATLPTEPLPNSARSIMLLSLLMGLVFGSVLVYVPRVWNRKISDPASIENEFGIPNMAILPYTNKQLSLSKKLGHHQLTPLLAQADPKDLSIEALRSFRTSVQFITVEAKNNILTISGIAPGVGKSFVSANFAYLLANAGQKILLIDGDIRKGHLNDYFDKGKPLGLTEVICNTCTLDQALITNQIPNLDFLATGTYPPNPSELLMSNRFKELLETVSKRYDMVIIDTAPILAVTDAAVIARLAGANFLVLASNTHESKEIDLALKRLQANGVKINGTIFNFSKKQQGFFRNTAVPTYQYQYEYK